MSDNNMQFELRWNDNAADRMTHEVEARVTNAGFHLQRKIVERLSSGAQSGKTYHVPGTQTTYTASAGGEVPAKVTGWLAQNVIAKPVLEWTGPVSYVGIRGGPDGVPYAKRLEYGFVGRDSLGRMYNQEARPFFRSTYEVEREDIKRMLGGR
ncbi:hypothetical protein ACFPRA_01375 [Sporosarcina soli]|uniref:HK97 gp10 family phage protein n=1 Tax=Sporosarcina soli TaxID=334736 RepID=A0ABW0TFP6_9BACL